MKYVDVPPSRSTADPIAAPSPPPAEDLELIRWTLSLSEEERLAVLQDFVDTFWTPRNG